MAPDWLKIRQKQLKARQSRQNQVHLAFSSQKQVRCEPGQLQGSWRVICTLTRYTCFGKAQKCTTLISSRLTGAESSEGGTQKHKMNTVYTGHEYSYTSARTRTYSYSKYRLKRLFIAGCLKASIIFFAINRYTWSLWCQKQVHSKTKYNHTPGALRLASLTSYLFLA